MVNASMPELLVIEAAECSEIREHITGDPVMAPWSEPGFATVMAKTGSAFVFINLQVSK